MMRNLESTIVPNAERRSMLTSMPSISAGKGMEKLKLVALRYCVSSPAGPPGQSHYRWWSHLWDCVHAGKPPEPPAGSLVIAPALFGPSDCCAFAAVDRCVERSNAMLVATSRPMRISVMTIPLRGGPQLFRYSRLHSAVLMRMSI